MPGTSISGASGVTEVDNRQVLILDSRRHIILILFSISLFFNQYSYDGVNQLRNEVRISFNLYYKSLKPYNSSLMTLIVGWSIQKIELLLVFLL
jgi:hypothetical protein